MDDDNETFSHQGNHTPEDKLWEDDEKEASSRTAGGREENFEIDLELVNPFPPPGITAAGCRAEHYSSWMTFPPTFQGTYANASGAPTSLLRFRREPRLLLDDRQFCRLILQREPLLDARYF